MLSVKIGIRFFVVIGGKNAEKSDGVFDIHCLSDVGPGDA
jgi:hypothetical protein